MYAKILAMMVAVGLLGGMSPYTLAADAAAERFPYLDEQEVERLREAGENACREALDTATRMSESFRAMSRDMTRLWSKAGEEFVREMAPALRDLADRLDEMARELGRPERPETI